MRRRHLLAVLSSAISLLYPLGIRAQQKAMPIIGFLHASPSLRGIIPTTFERGLNETGFINGENFRIEFRTSAAELIEDGAEVIIVAAGGSIEDAHRATTSIPIVAFMPLDPVSAGLVASLNRPGGNVTGVSWLVIELLPKRLQILRQLVPQAKMCAVLINPGDPSAERLTRGALQKASGEMGLALEIIPARAESEFEAAFARTASLKADALLVTTDALFTRHSAGLAGLAQRYAVPTSYPWRLFVLDGGLVSYGPSLPEGYHQLGIYAGQILKGAKPADLPVEQPTRFELVINLKTAKALGLTVPQSLLARADEVIE